MPTTPKLGPTDGPCPKTRVDAAHTPTQSAKNSIADPPLELLQAIAGHDNQVAPQQLRGQALELAALLRDKHRVLEQRESELNARSALLENDLRSARLHRFSHDVPRTRAPREEGQESRETSANADACTGTIAGDHEVESEAVSADARRPRHEPVREQHEASRDRRFTEAPAPESPKPEVSNRMNAAALKLPERAASEVSRDVAAEQADDVAPQRPVDEARGTVDELDEQFDHLEKQRQQLREREEKLASRQRHVEQMHDEVTVLHREALELRLASEQVWADLTEEFPSEELSQSMALIRSKLADHYRLAHDALAQRKDELHELRTELNQQEQRQRQQRRDIQMWADRRYDEIESRLAKIILRERELDQMESEFQRQSLQWQQQREAYRQEIEQLSWQMHERTAG